MSKLITEKDALIATFPYSLSRDTDKLKLAVTVADGLVEMSVQLEYAMIFSRVDELPEEILDILAVDLNIQWYDNEADIECKRSTIKECMHINKYKGTKYAIEKALKSVYDDVRVIEWNEYGGEPYHFKIIIYDSSNDREKRDRVLDKVKYYKNLRSVLEETIFETGINTDIAVLAAFKTCGIHKRIGCEVKNYG
jgi:phage tail P2-like protein|nr:MAG TPA: tail protein [Caudoviricetes sp.]